MKKPFCSLALKWSYNNLLLPRSNMNKSLTTKALRTPINEVQTAPVSPDVGHESCIWRNEIVVHTD